MAVKSIISIDVDDSAYQRFAKQFNDYQETLKKTPEAWRNANVAADGLSASAGLIAAATASAAASLHKLTIENAKTSKAVKDQERSWHAMARDSGKFASNIVEATRSLLSWAKLTGIIGGILGVGGLFGIDRLAGGAGNQRATALSLGLQPGEAKGYEAELGGRGYNYQEYLNNIARGMLDVTSEQYKGLLTLGVKTQGKDTNAVALETLDRLKTTIDKLPLDNLFLTRAHAMPYGNLLNDEDLLKLRRTPADEAHGYAGKIRQDQNALTFQDQTAKAWQDLKVQLTLAASTLENVLIKRLVALSGPIEHLSAAFVKVVDDLLSRPELKDWIGGLADVVKQFGDFLGSAAFKEDVGKFMQGVSDLGSAAKSIVDEFGGIQKVFADIKTVLSEELEQDIKDFTGLVNLLKDAVDIVVKAFNSIPSLFGGKNSDPNSWSLDPSYLWHRFWKGDTGSPLEGVQKESFNRLEGENALPHGILASVARTESGFNPNAISPAGAKGEFQFMDATARTYGVANPFDPNQSSAGAAKYLRKLMDEFHGDIEKALAGYNWGEGNVEKDIAQYGANWKAHLPRETQEYIEKVGRGVGQPAPNMHPNPGRPTSVAINVYNNTGGSAIIAASQLAI